MKNIERVAIMGLGAMGVCFAQQIIQFSPQTTVYGIVREMKNVWGTPFLFNGCAVQINYRTVETLKQIPIDLVLVCVKTYQLERALEDLQALVGPKTMILSILRGVQSNEPLYKAFGPERVIEGVMPDADIRREGHTIVSKSCGTLYFGTRDKSCEEQLAAVEEFFHRCRLPSQRVDCIDYYRWKQMLICAGFEQTCTAFQQCYGDFLRNEHAMNVMRTAQKEIIALAQHCGVELAPGEIPQWEAYLHTLAPEGYPAMLQDYRKNRRLESDAFCDALCGLAQEAKIPVPANQWIQEQLHTLLRKRFEISSYGLCTRQFSSRQRYFAEPDKIANQIRVEILNGAYASKNRLSEKELADRFDASRSSVRTALQTLTNEGLLQTLPNGRREVLPFSKKQLNDLFELRWLLEQQALQQIFKNRQSVYPLLAHILGKMEEKYRADSLNMSWNELDVCFHKNLVDSAENTFLSKAWENCAPIWYTATLFYNEAETEKQCALEIFMQHKHLYERILAGDKAVYPALKRHIDEQKEALFFVFGALAND